ncbi:MAG: AAA family ATPase [Planctomycetota bacterium]
MPDDVLSVFVGYGEDSREDVRSVWAQLEYALNHGLRDAIASATESFVRVELVDWRQSGAASQQDVEQQLERANAGIFVFRERVGNTSWDEMTQLRSRDDRPPVFVAFCSDPPERASLLNIASVENWLDLLRKKRDLERSWNDEAVQSPRVFRYHKAPEILVGIHELFLEPCRRLVVSGRRAHAGPSLLHPPLATEALRRTELLAQLRRRLSRSGTVAVYGLPGSGKTTLVAQHIQDPAEYAGGPYWYQASNGSTLDDLLVPIGEALSLMTKATRDRCVELANLLESRDAILVLDDFHRVDLESCEPLFKAVKERGTRCRLVFVTQQRPDASAPLYSISALLVDGLSREERTEFVRRAHFGVDRDFIDQLCEQTMGMPILLDVICNLATDREGLDRFHAELEESGEQCTPDAIRGALQGFFDRSVAGAGSAGQALLGILALVGGPFDRALIHGVAQRSGIADVDGALHHLSSSLLLRRERDDTWRVHSLIEDLARRGMPSDTQRECHGCLADYYRAGIDADKYLEYSASEVLNLERACLHLQAAGKYEDSRSVLNLMAVSGKRHGLYGKLIRLATEQRRHDPDVGATLDYHYAHCCFIQGRLGTALETLEPRVSRLNELGDSGMRVMTSRLYAEVIAADGRPAEGLDVLERALAQLEDGQATSPVIEHAWSAKVYLLTELARLEEAKELALELLEACPEERRVGRAVLLTRLGIIELNRHNPEQAAKQLRAAEAIFRGSDGEPLDRRGLAWTSHLLSAACLELGDVGASTRLLRESMAIQREIDERSPQSIASLRLLRLRGYSQELLQEVDEQLEWAGAGAQTAPIRVSERSLVLMIGASGSGKSWFVDRNFRPSQVTSSDDLRERISDDASDQSINPLTFQLARDIAEGRMKLAKLTVIDATNLRSEDRRGFLDLAARFNHTPVAIVLDLPEEICVEQDRARPGRTVGDAVIRAQRELLARSLDMLEAEGIQQRHVLTSKGDLLAARVVVE